jgi:hypothetical protein
MIQAIVILVTVKVFISTSTHTVWSVMWQVLSVAAFYGCFAIFSYVEPLFAIDSYNLTGLFPVLMNFLT